MTAGKLHITDKKSRSTRRALLRFLRHCDYGFHDIAIEISDIIRRSPISFSCSVAAIVARLAENGFEFVAMCDRRAMRILSQIADEYFRRSGTAVGAPFVCILPLKALRAAVGSSKALNTQFTHNPYLPRAPSTNSSPIVGLLIGKWTFSYASTTSDTMVSSTAFLSLAGVSSVTSGKSSSMRLSAYSYCCFEICRDIEHKKFNRVPL